MNLNAIFETIFSPQTIYICLAIYVVTFAIRKVVEAAWLGAKKNRLWNEAFVPVGPIANGALLGLAAKTFVWPEFAAAVEARMMYGAVCGMFSALVYNRIRAWVKSKPSKGSSESEDDKALPAAQDEPSSSVEDETPTPKP